MTYVLAAAVVSTDGGGSGSLALLVVYVSLAIGVSFLCSELYPDVVDRRSENVPLGQALVTAPDEVRSRLKSAMWLAARCLGRDGVELRARVDGEPHWGQVRSVLVGAIGRARSQPKYEELHGSASALRVSELHPAVWEAVRESWRKRAFEEAQKRASVAVETMAQDKPETPQMSGQALWEMAFSVKPPKSTAPRLRLRFDDGRASFNNVHVGAEHFAKALYGGVRNLVAHVNDDPDPAESLELLAAWSTLARWVDRSAVERA